VLAEELATIDRIARAHHARDVSVARSEVESERLWTARRSISPALARRRPNKLGEDVCVPPRAITALVRRVREIAATYALPIPLFGHIGDGNLHPNILCDKTDREEMTRVPAPRAQSSKRPSSSAGRSQASTASGC